MSTKSIQHETGAIFADGERTVASRHDAGEFVTAWATRWGFRNIQSALTAICEVEEEFAQEGRSGISGSAIDTIKKIFFAMNQFRGSKQMFFHLILFALCQEHVIPPRILGNGDKLPIHSQQDLADKWHCSKANIAKNLKWLQEMCGLPERPDQRDERARKHMEQARRNQLTPKSGKKTK